MTRFDCGMFARSLGPGRAFKQLPNLARRQHACEDAADKARFHRGNKALTSGRERCNGVTADRYKNRYSDLKKVKPTIAGRLS